MGTTLPDTYIYVDTHPDDINKQANEYTVNDGDLENERLIFK